MEHVFTESMFLVGFVIFIAAILVLDMLVTLLPRAEFQLY